MGLKGFVEGGIASIIAGCSTHPLDLIKVRMQLQGETLTPPLRPALALHNGSTMAIPAPPPMPKPGPIAVGAQILRSEGGAALFSGVSATVLRQTLYSTTRMGLYDILKKKWSPAGDGAALPLHLKVAAGLVAGGIGAAVGNPADVAMVRMQADGRLPAAERRNYRGVGDAITRMARAEGVTSLWRGSSLTVNRAMIVTASQLATYDQAKEAILANGGADGMGTHVAASFAAGVVAAAASNPVDVVKTRVMNMKVEKGAAPPYAGAIDCAVKTVRAEGVMALYKGFIPTVSRQGPFTVVLFVTLEQVRKLLKDF
ncbi:mitochondrial uncoupling protein 5-like [Typha angustifolia]|uniref:mitochondrial uncoupling protein 5-like n=1 Tax=Typha angustifolia TaxID=59011 RepID=UPI003C2C9F9A